MRGRKKTYRVALQPTQIDQLHQVVNSRKSLQSEVLRARVILTCGQSPDQSDAQVAGQVGCSAGMVRKWRKRWGQSPSLQEAPRAGRPRVFSP